MSVACMSDWGAGARLGEARGEGSEESPMRRCLWTPLGAAARRQRVGRIGACAKGGEAPAM
jgi:hypothetical protein